MPDVFFDLSWYEADLMAQQNEYSEQRQWLHTRTIRAALTGENPTAIIKLPYFDSAQQVKAPSKAEQEAIINKYKSLLNGK